MIKLTDDQRLLVRSLALKQGATYEGITDITNLPRSAVVEECRAVGLIRRKGPVPGSESGRAPYTKEDLARAMEIGQSMASFARSRGVSRQAVCAAAKRWGLTPISKNKFDTKE